MEEGENLELALGAERHWLAARGLIEVVGAATPFGPVSYRLQFEQGTSTVHGEWSVAHDPRYRQSAAVNVHVRLPGGLRIRSVNPESGASVANEGESLQWKAPRETVFSGRYHSSMMFPKSDVRFAMRIPSPIESITA